MTVGYIVVVLAAAIWGFEVVLIRQLVNRMPFAVVGCLSHTISAVLLLLGMLAVRNKALARLRTDALTIRRLAVIGLMGATLNVMAFYGFCYTSAVNGAILARTDVFFALLISLLILRERIRLSGWLAMALMLLGVCLIVLKGHSGLQVHVLGDAMILGSALLLAVNAMQIRCALGRTDPYVISMVNCFCIGLGFLAMAVASLGPASVLTGAAANAGGVVLLGVALVGGFVFYYIGLRLLPLWEVRILMLLTPVSSALFGIVMLKESMAVGQVVGMAAVMAGAAIISLANRNVPAEVVENTEVMEADHA